MNNESAAKTNLPVIPACPPPGGQKFPAGWFRGFPAGKFALSLSIREESGEEMGCVKNLSALSIRRFYGEMHNNYPLALNIQ